jgi:hypothetical protein
MIRHQDVCMYVACVTTRVPAQRIEKQFVVVGCEEGLTVPLN